METANQFNHDVRAGIKNRLEVFGPNYVTRHPGLFFALEVAIADVGQAEHAIAAFAQNFGHGAAHGSEAHQGNPARERAIP